MLRFFVFFAAIVVAPLYASVARLTVCEWARPDSRKLTCPKGHVVKILTALYGRKSIQICSHAYHNNVKNCGSDSGSLSKASGICNGKQECVLRASNRMFGDPCWGINKYLDVSYTCEAVQALNKDLLTPYVGTWTLKYSNTHKDAYTVSKDGKVTLSSSGRSVFLSQSDNQVDFPTSKGWYKLNGIYRPTAWEYVRLNEDGTMEVHHFYTGGTGKYKHTKNYCCSGQGFQIAAEGRPTKTYIVVVKTSSWHGAGTSSKTYVTFFGELGDTGRLLFGKDFSRSTEVTFMFKAMDVGKMTMMKIGHDNSKAYAPWHVDSVVVKVDGCTDTFSVWQWIQTGRLQLDVYPTLEKGQCPASNDKTTYTSYAVTIKTSNVYYGGTASNTHIIIHGEKGETGKLFFKQSFYLGTTKTIVFETVDVGKITQIRIQNDNNDAWHIDTLSIKSGKCTTSFTVKRWIYHRSGDTFKPSSQTGQCESSGTIGSICRRDFKKIGCFTRDWTKVTQLLITDLDPSHKNYTQDMNWDDYAEGLHSLACRCRAKALGRYKYFGIGFLGECVAGDDRKSLEAMFKERKIEGGGGCVNGKWDKCQVSHHAECAGDADFDFFYEIVE